MRYPLTATVVFLAVLIGHAQGPTDKAPPWAKFRLGGEIRDLLDLRSKLNVAVLLDRDLKRASKDYRWDGPPPTDGAKDAEVVHLRSVQVGSAAWVVVLLDQPEAELEPLLPKLRPASTGRPRVVFEGRLSAASDRDPFVAHANGTGQLRLVKEGEKPIAVGNVEIEGQALPGKHELAKGKTTPLAIQNGTSPILVTGKALEQGIPPGGPVIVTGKLLVAKQGPLVVEAESIRVK